MYGAVLRCHTEKGFDSVAAAFLVLFRPSEVCVAESFNITASAVFA
jgi:hypothetical protein